MTTEWIKATNVDLELAVTGTGAGVIDTAHQSGLWTAHIEVTIGAEGPRAPVLGIKVELRFRNITTEFLKNDNYDRMPRTMLTVGLISSVPGANPATSQNFPNWTGTASLTQDSSQPAPDYPFFGWPWKLSIVASGSAIGGRPAPPGNLRVIS
jgi:hypothetical protein